MNPKVVCMTTNIIQKLKPNIKLEKIQQVNGIFCCINDDFISGDNQKYMKMYDWMSFVYDFAEKWIGKLKYGNTIDHLRTELMSKLEWKNNISVLYVSIGTGADLRYIPRDIDLHTIDLYGADISIGMLKKCKKQWQKRTNLTLVQCPAEDLPFADNTFDMVFHIGGINFFNDKARAVQEMIRVAKTGSRLLIADETADFVEQQYKKSIFSKSYFEDKTVDLSDIEACIPSSVEEKQTQLLWDNKFYCITFKKNR